MSILEGYYLSDTARYFLVDRAESFVQILTSFFELDSIQWILEQGHCMLKMFACRTS